MLPRLPSFLFITAFPLSHLSELLFDFSSFREVTLITENAHKFFGLQSPIRVGTCFVMNANFHFLFHDYLHIHTVYKAQIHQNGTIISEVELRLPLFLSLNKLNKQLTDESIIFVRSPICIHLSIAKVFFHSLLVCLTITLPRYSLILLDCKQPITLLDFMLYSTNCKASEYTFVFHVFNHLQSYFHQQSERIESCFSVRIPLTYD